ncbi:loganic acid O-methyltransferase-like isoform X2 [Salvia hispanica]|uniref:loganic acid O-methyltransferase-like isoform X1 n=1 Tax=Salvia hispanica TaxID=49212 RepID=UPI0020091BF0|nr:loganic acid O-methyltransferase-like isoform X1 [Salvia hispanica]XP_047952622.1 loganic acid O-methyltransferase-like isoform X2 [Salvia hispanica]
MAESISPMNGGSGTYSYARNSTWQRKGALIVEDAIKEAVMESLDLPKVLCDSNNTFVVADLGCSVGPNTFYAMDTIIEAVQRKCNNNSSLEFQVAFNDRIGNDFNTLFASLPEHGRNRNYFAAAVPGSFYGRLFPSSSIHIAYSSASLNWLSKVPECSNAAKIHYSGAPDAVARAYEAQFEEDMEAFFRCRAREIAVGGLMLFNMAAVPSRDVQHHLASMLTFIESIFIDMVKEGVIAQERVDSFNFPIVFPCVEEVRRLIEKNKCFEIVKMEKMERPLLEGGTKIAVMHLRAGLEGTLSNHFGNEIVEQVFERTMQQHHKLQSTQIHTSSTGIFVVLRRN